MLDPKQLDKICVLAFLLFILTLMSLRLPYCRLEYVDEILHNGEYTRGEICKILEISVSACKTIACSQ
jgi:hypothetical protein